MLKPMMLIAILFSCGLVSAQSKRTDRIRLVRNVIEGKIKDGDLVETKIDFNANRYAYDFVPGIVSFWQKPYEYIVPVKVRTYKSASMIGTNTEYYYDDSGACFLISVETEDFGAKSSDRYDLYFQGKECVQIDLVKIKGKMETSRSIQTAPWDENLKALINRHIELANRQLEYYRNVNAGAGGIK